MKGRLEWWWWERGESEEESQSGGDTEWGMETVNGKD